MFNETMLALGKKRSCIRELFEYGLRQAQVVGKENVYDYSLGNPSIPAPPEVNETFIRVIRDMDSLAVHSYTPAPGAYDARKAVADELNERFGTAIRPENLFFTCGAAPALLSVIKALAVPDAEIIGLAPYFPEYRPFTEASGARLRPSRSTWRRWRRTSRPTPRPSSSTPRITPPAWSTAARR